MNPSHTHPPNAAPTPNAEGASVARKAPHRPKKPYLPPRVEAYGRVGALTAGPFGGVSDTFSGGSGGFTQFSP